MRMISETGARMTMTSGLDTARLRGRAPSRPLPSPRATVCVGALLGLLLVLALLGVLLGVRGSGHATAPGRPAFGAGPRAARRATYGRIPLSFERNDGQSIKGVAFLSRGAGYALGLTGRGPILALARHGARGGSAVQLRFVGGASTPTLVASGRLPGRVNYLTGRDPRRWRTGIPTYARVTYRAVWPGIDVSFYGNQRTLEYDFRLRAGANPGRVAFRLSGARHVRLNRNGDLLIGLHGRTVRELAPRAYQQTGGARVVVASRYILLPHDQVKLRVGAYDHKRALVIDPVLDYATYLGGSGTDFTNPGIAFDSSGSEYVEGPTFSTDFPTTPGAFQTTTAATPAGYVAKLNPAGTAFEYVTYLSGPGGTSQATEGVTVDSSGDAYVTGASDSAGFPTTPGAFQTTNAGGTDDYVLELNPSGSALIFSTLLGGNGPETPGGIALGPGGDVYVSGSTGSTNFPTTPGALQTTYGGGTDGFVAELNPTGSALIYSTFLGGTGDDVAQGIAPDAGGSAYVDGTTNSTDFPTTPGAFQTAYGGGANDLFVVKLNPTGSALTYSTYLGGSGKEGPGYSVAIDSMGSAYVTGSTTSTNFPVTPGAFQTTYPGGTRESFVTKLNGAGSALAYSTYLGGQDGAGTAFDSGANIALDAAGSAYVSGQTSSTTFPTTPGAFQISFGGGPSDGYVSELNARGTGLVYSTYIGGSAFDITNGIKVDAAGNVYIGGSTGSANFPVTPGAPHSTLAGAIDGFLLKFSLPAYLRTTSTSVSCSPAVVLVGAATRCTAVVTDTDAGPVSAPSGTVSFAGSPSGSFAPGAACALAATAAAGQSSCSVLFMPTTAATDTIGAAYGGDAGHGASQGSTTLTVTAVQLVITVTTGSASGVTVSSAILHGVVDTRGVAVTWEFQYGRTTRYGSATSVQTIAAGRSSVSASWMVRRLRPLTRYHFRLVGVYAAAGGGVQSVYGRDVTFTTKATGRLLLDGGKLTVRRAEVSPRFTCSSSLPCKSKLSITTRARLRKDGKLATVVCAATRRFFKIRAHKRLSVRVGVHSACRSLLRMAAHHRIAGKLTANPNTGQHAVIRNVTLVLR